MSEKAVTMNEVRETINHLVQGVDPYTGEVLETVSFLQNPRMIRCFAMMSDLSTMVIEKEKRKQLRDRLPFKLSQEDYERIQLPLTDCGVNAIANAINKVIDQQLIKPVTGYMINQRLISEGILSAEEGDKGRKSTIVNDSSESYGIVSVHVETNDRSYDKLIFNKIAKDYVYDHLMKWFG